MPPNPQSPPLVATACGLPTDTHTDATTTSSASSYHGRENQPAPSIPSNPASFMSAETSPPFKTPSLPRTTKTVHGNERRSRCDKRAAPVTAPSFSPLYQRDRDAHGPCATRCGICWENQQRTRNPTQTANYSNSHTKRGEKRRGRIPPTPPTRGSISHHHPNRRDPNAGRAPFPTTTSLNHVSPQANRGLRRMITTLCTGKHPSQPALALFHPLNNAATCH